MARLRRDYQGERRTQYAGCFLTPSERSDLTARAATVNLSVSDYIRNAVFGRRMPAASVDRSQLQAVALELTRVGNNLNQLARIANTIGQVKSEQALQAVLDQLASAVERVIKL